MHDTTAQPLHGRAIALPMVRENFDESFERLRDQSNHLADIERSKDNFDEIVEERVKLDRLRDEVTNERKNIVSRYEPPLPMLLPLHCYRSTGCKHETLRQGRRRSFGSPTCRRRVLRQ